MTKHTLTIALALAAMLLAGCPAPEPAGEATAGSAASATSNTQAPPVEATQPPDVEIPAQGATAANAATDFEYTMFDGTKHKLSDNFGKPTVVNFWADWCPPCVAELPHFEEVWQAKGSEFNLVAIAVDSAKDPQGFVSTKGFKMPFANDVNGAATYKVTGIPMTLFIDKDGSIAEQVVGGMDKATFELNLAKIL